MTENNVQNEPQAKKSKKGLIIGIIVALLIVGGAVNYFVTTRSKDAEVNRLRGEKGTLLASGFIAGGALMGVVSAALQFGGVQLALTEWTQTAWAEWLSLAMYAALIIYLYKASLKIK